MSSDGNRICLDATPGNENIEICDQYGNQVVLHASVGVIKIQSPSMDSKILVGNTGQDSAGIYGYTEGDIYLKAERDMYLKSENQYNKRIEGLYKTWVGGSYRTTVNGLYALRAHKEYYSQVNGAKYDFVWGGKLDVCAPLKTEICVGLKIEGFLGGKLDVSLAEKHVIEMGWKYVHCKADEQKRTDGEWESTSKVAKLKGDESVTLKAPRIVLDGEVGLYARGQCISLNDAVMKIKQ